MSKYYQKHKERLHKEPRESYQNISREEKDKRRNKAQERYQNFIEEEKSNYWNTLTIPRKLNLFHGLVLEM